LNSQPADKQVQTCNFGRLGVVIWPTYMGAATADPGEGPVPLHEPFDDIDYSRGQIVWYTQPDGDILGSARVYVPKGVYTHFVFCHGPVRELMIGKRQLEQPIIFDRAGVIDIEPIQNKDYLPRPKFLNL
jgi:hypothetical protein